MSAFCVLQEKVSQWVNGYILVLGANLPFKQCVNVVNCMKEGHFYIFDVKQKNECSAVGVVSLKEYSFKLYVICI